MNKHKVKISVRQHNKIFKNRQVEFSTYYEIIDDPENRDIKMRKYIRMPIRIIYILLSPLAIFVGGVPCMISLIKECLSAKDVGADSVNREWFYKTLRGDHE